MKKLLSKLQSVLFFLRLTDDNGVLSITHIACGVVLFKIATAAQPSIADMGALLVTLSLYYGKTHLKHKKLKLSDENKTAIDEMKAKVQQISDKTSGMALHMGMRTPIK